MRRIICVFFLFLSACVSKQGQDFSAVGAEQIKIGTTSKTTVEQLLGPPLTKDIKGVDESWGYSYAATDASNAVAGSSIAAGVPIVGPLLSVGVMQNTPTTNESRQVLITFHRDIVQTCNVRLVSGTNTMLNTLGQSTTREIPCGQPIN
jgi:outer membrane protein assembly factor BamE (lipoprotein component of BamABCDE complex)